MNVQRFHLNDPRIRMEAMRLVQAAPDGYVCEIKPRTRTLDQNAKLHALFADIARQVEFFGARRDAQTVKRLLVDAFARVKEAMGEPLAGYGQVLPSLDGQGVVQLGLQTRRFSKTLMSELIAYLMAWGADNGVRFSDDVQVPDWYQDRVQDEQGMAA